MISSSTGESLVELLKRRAAAHPEAPLYTFLLDGEHEERVLTYGQLATRARAVATRLAQVTAPGERALLLCEPGLDYITAFFGCLYARVVAVPAYPPNPVRLERTLPRLQAVAEDARTAVVLTTTPILELKEGLVGMAEPGSVFTRATWLAVDDIPEREAAHWKAPGVGRTSVAFLQYTSGSTSAPRGVVLTHGNLLHNLEITSRAFGTGSDSRLVIWLPPYHDMGLIGGLLQPLYAGFPATLLSPLAFLSRPLRWLEAISRTRATISGGPNFAYDLCVRKSTPEERARLDLSAWRVAFSGAEPIRPRTLDAFVEAFAPSGFARESFFACYGLAEGTLFVTGGARGQAPVLVPLDAEALRRHDVRPATGSTPVTTLVGCGTSPSDQRVLIVEPETRTVCPPERVGEIWVSGPSVAQGYWQRPEESQATFGARLASGEGAFLRTGDLGFLTGPELVVTGRLKDLLIIRGRNHYPQDLERTLEGSHPAIRGGCCAAFPVEVEGEERLVVAAEVRPDSVPEQLYPAVLRALSEAHELQPHDVVLLAPGALPKTSSGKVQRRACKDGYLTGTLEELGRLGTHAPDTASAPAPAMPATPVTLDLAQVERWLLEQVRAGGRLPPGTSAASPLASFGLDSLATVHLSHAVERELGVTLPLARYLVAPSLSALATEILRARAEVTVRAGPEDERLLSEGERALWFLQRMSPRSTAYHVSRAVRISGAPDVEGLERAFTQVVARHEALRTSFPAVEGAPRRVIHPPGPFSLVREEASGMAEAELRRRAGAWAAEPFDVEAGPLLRAKLFSLGDARALLVLSAHHLVCDFWSLGLVFGELRELYTAGVEGRRPRLPAVTHRYVDHIAWQRQWLGSPEGQRALAAWREALAGPPPVLDLPTDLPRTETPSTGGESRSLLVPARVAKSLRTLTEATGTTAYTVLLACFQLLLHRHTGQDGIVVGSPFAGRGRESSAGVVGYFVNTLALRTRFREGMTFFELLQALKSTVAAALSAGDYPFSLLPAKLEVPRTGGRSPLFQVMFDLQRAPVHEDAALTSLAHGTGQGEPIAFGPLVLTPFALPPDTAQFELTLAATERPEGLSLVMEYDPALFGADTIERLLQGFATLLEAAVRAPGDRVMALPLLGTAQRERLLRASRGPHTELPALALEQRIARQAAATPEADAVRSGTRVLSYQALCTRSARLATELSARGVGPDQRVGLLLPRSEAFLTAALATLEAGAAFVALDPSHPPERLRELLGSADIRLWLTTSAHAGVLAPPGALQVPVEDVLLVEPGGPRAAPSAPAPVRPEHLAYVSYTSGSSGRPKGVMVSREAMHNHAEAIRRAYALVPGDRVLHFAAVTFDVALEELFPPLLAGAAVVVRPDDVGDVRAFLDFVRAQGVTVLNLPASYWHELVTALATEHLSWPPCVRLVVVGSEAVRADRVRAWDALGLSGVRLVNAYGPTECAVTATLHTHQAPLTGTGLPIGQPLDNLEARVLDPELNPAAPGVLGELYLAGRGLARGYLGRPELTAEVFLPDPHALEEGARMYRTGDLARLRADGRLEFVGRADQQVKVRGFRIEPAEVEAALAREPSLREWAVVARTDGGPARLVAYVVPASADGFSLPRLQESLARTLPAYLLPSAFQVLSALPQLPNGKVDRRALPAPERTTSPTGRAPESEVERTLVEVWKSVLRVDTVGVEDNFFDLGGESLLAIQLISRMRQAGLGLTTAQIFQHQTIARLARVAVPLAASVQEPRPEGEVPLTPIQRDFFAIDTREPHHWNQEVLLGLAPDVEPARLRHALESVVAAHDAFRLRFERAGQGWRQFHAPVGTPGLVWVEAREARVTPAAAQDVRARLDLARGPLCGAVLVGRELFIAIHHLIVDAVSWRILLDDLSLAYRQLEAGGAVELPLPTASFQRWSQTLEAHGRSPAVQAQADYWRERWRDAAHALPRDGAGPDTEASAEELTVHASAALTQRLLHALPARHRLSVQEVLLAALTRVLTRWSGQRAVCVDVEGHGREGLDLSRTVGWFTSVFPFRLEGPGEDAMALLAHVKSALHEVPERGLGHGLWRAHGGEGRSPGAPLLFNYLGQLDLDARGARLFTPLDAQLGAPRSPTAARTHPLTLDCSVQSGQLRFTWGFSLAVHSRETSSRLATALLTELESLVEAALAARSRLLTASDFPLARLSSEALQALATSQEGLEDVYPLSPVQESMLFHHLYSPDSGVTVEQSVFRVIGALDVEAFESAWRTLFQRHPSLRATVHWRGLPHPVQVVHTGLALPIARLDWRTLPAEQARTALQRLLEEDRARGYELDRAPLMRLFLLHRADTEWEVVWSHHHLIIDGYSLPVVVRELDVLYTALSAGRPVTLEPARPFRDYLAWQQRQDLKEAESFWRERLQGFTTPVRLLQGGAPATGAGTGAVGRSEARLEPALQARLREAARRQRVTLSTLVQGAWALLLSRYSGQRDIVFGSTTSGRPSALEGVESMVGCFMNTLPRRVTVHARRPLGELLRAFQQQQEEVRRFEFTPLALVRSWSEVPRNSALYDLYETVVVFEDYPLDQFLERGLGGLTLRPSDFEAQLDYPLVLYVFPQPELRFILVADLAAVSQPWVELMLERFVELLEAIAEQPDVTPAGLDWVRGRALAQLEAWNRTHRPMPEELVFTRIDAWAALTPHAPAVVFEEQRLDYAGLKDRSDRLATLLRARGIGPETTVGLFFDRSLESMIGTFGVLKSGGAYVPIDPSYPADRIAYMIADARSPVILTQRKLLERLPAHAGETLCLDEPGLLDGVEPLPLADIPLDAPAYVIYTSGSTGRPKGVQVTHRNIANSTFARYFALPSNPRAYLLLAPFSFDAAGCGIYWTLQTGGALVLPPEALRENALELPRLIEHHRISHLSFTPSLYSAVLDVAGPQQLASLELVIVAGEALPPALVERHHRVVPQALLFNEYGPTEFTIWGTVHPCVPEPGARHVPIGRALTNMQTLVLDEHLRRVPPGFMGELYLRGDNLARGYYRRPELTAERFLPDPHAPAPGGRMYRTGDLVRHRPDGALEFLGRADHQVKIRGFRVEPAEVEAALEAHPDLRDKVVLARRDGGEVRLVAYVVPRAGVTPPSVCELRRFLGRSLPDYLVPSAFVFLDALPLSPNGKADRGRLPAPVLEREAMERPMIAPRTPTERTVARVWAEVLELPEVGVEDGFFDVGGHSLKATQVVSRLRDALRVELPLRALFEAPTVAGLSERIEALRRPEAPRLEAIPRREDTGETPLSFAQQRLWFLDQLEPQSAAYHIPLALRLSGRVDAEALQRAFDTVVARHEILRTVFPSEEGRPSQRLVPASGLHLDRADLRGLEEGARTRALTGLLVEEARRPLPLAEGPLARACLVALGDSEHVLLLTLHHIIADGWSMGVLVRELTQAYLAHARGQAPELPALPIQYADYAAWQRRWLRGEVLEQQVAWWREQLAGAPPVLQLPTSRPRPARVSDRGATERLSLSAEQTRAVHALARQEDVTPFMVLLAAFGALLHRCSGQTDLVVGTPIANRHRAEVEPLVGFFVNTLALRADLSGDPSFRALLARTRETTLGAYAHQDVPFELLVEALQPGRDLGRTPFFQVMLVVQNAPLPALAVEGLSLTPLATDSATAKFDLTLFLEEDAGRMLAAWEYRTELFDAAAIQRLHGQFATLLAEALRRPELPVSRLPLLSPDERRRMLSFSDGPVPPASRPLVHEAFAAQVARTPEAVAVVCGAERLTYRALASRVHALARALRARGVGPETRVGLFLERSNELVVALLAVLEAGGAYVPLEPGLPPTRLAFLLQQAAPSVVLTSAALRAALPEHPAPVLLTDAGASPPRDEALPLVSGVGEENLAYVLYTSGSTGTPKGVMVTHGGLANYLAWCATAYAPGSGSGAPVHSPLGFDLTVTSLFAPLLAGRTVTLVPAGQEVEGLVRALREGEPFSLVKLTPAHLELLRHELPAKDAGKAHTLIIGGEALVAETLQFWREHAPGTRLINEYGPTETVVGCCTFEVPADHPPTGAIPIGRPLPDTRLYVLDARLEPVPVGVVGELYIGGAGVARGYLGRPDLTAERFLPDPFGTLPGARLYRSGDLARYLPGGVLDFLGRADHQVKIRGFRVEPEEIQSTLERHPGVAAAAVRAREDLPGGRQLVAYVTSRAGSLLTTEELKEELKTFLTANLPGYMVPAWIVVLEALPLTANGKVDHGSLPAPSRAATSGTPPVAPRTPTEKDLGALFATVLGVPTVGIHDNFFELGGHSLLATQLLARVRARFEVPVELRDAFQSPTVAGLAALIDEHLARETARLEAELGEEISQLSDEEVEQRLRALESEEDSGRDETE